MAKFLESLRLTMLFYAWMLNSNKIALLDLVFPHNIRFKLDVVCDKRPLVMREQLLVYENSGVPRYLARNDLYYSLVVVIDIPKDDPQGFFSRLKTISAPIIFLTKEEGGLRKEEVIKNILDMENCDGFTFMVMEEKDSAVCRQVMERANGVIANIQILRHPTVITLIVIYTCLAMLLVTMLTIIYIFVAIYSEKDPVCLPGALEKCPLIKYTLLPNKESCRKCMVCLEDFLKNDTCRLLGCQHFFHAGCIDPWLKSKSSRCPLCSQHLNIELSI